jgi:hypothetical protein
VFWVFGLVCKKVSVYEVGIVCILFFFVVLDKWWDIRIGVVGILPYVLYIIHDRS